MDLSQEAILSFLTHEGGKVKKSHLVSKFKSAVDCADPAERERNRELFKNFVNSVAFVKEIDGDRYVLLRQKAARPQVRGEESCVGHTESGNTSISPEQGDKKTGGESVRIAAEEEEKLENPSELGSSSVELALRRSKSRDLRAKQLLNVGAEEKARMGQGLGESSVKSKPFGLPLRCPVNISRMEFHQLKADSGESAEFKEPSLETSGSPPLVRRSTKGTCRSPEEHKDSRAPSGIPLEPAEHEWMVKCAAGQWNQAYGLLLNDCHLADKRDFMSGFTALHWAAKSGNVEMLLKIMDVSRKGGVDVDVNAKTHGGYTPLHIAALHHQEYVMVLLVGELGADTSVRDNCGKKAHHYLHGGTSGSVKEMLGAPSPHQTHDRPMPEREDTNLPPELVRSRHSIGRLFQPGGTGQRKRHKQRSGFYSLGDDFHEEREGGSFRLRLASDTSV